MKKLFLKFFNINTKSSLSWKLLFNILVFSSAFTVIVSAYQLFYDYKTDVNIIHQRMDLIENSYLSQLTDNIWMVNSIQANVVLKSILNLPDVEYIELTDRTTELSVSMGQKNFKNGITRKFALIHSTAQGETFHLGNLVVTTTLKNIYNRLIDKLLVILGTQAIKTFFVSFFIFLITYRLIVRHLFTIAQFANSVSFDTLGLNLELNRKKMPDSFDELDQVSDAINDMQLRLHNEINERKKTEEALRESEERFRAIYEHAPILIDAFNENGRCILWNNECRKTFGWTIEEINAHDDALSLFYPDPVLRNEVLSTVTTDPDAYFREWHPITKDGITLDTMWANFSLPDGLTFNLGYDITERNKMEARLLQSQKMESIGTLAGGIAHDFNNLLYPIIGFAEMLKEDLPPNSPEHESAQEIFNAGRRGGELVKQILAFSRQTEHKLSPVRFQKILAEVCKLIRSTIPSDIEIHQDIQKDCGLVMAEATQLHQIAMNLITNAYHAVEKVRGNISIQLKEIMLDNDDLNDSPLQPGQYVLLSVSDNGGGIPKEIINNIFEPYFTTKEKGKGTGLGLAVVYGILAEHKGDIKVYSEVDKGTTFNVYLPLMKKSDEAISKKTELNKLTGIERILLVDDEESIVRLEKQMLERLGYKVSARFNSLEALETFNSNPEGYDLVISDMTMPNMTGDQLARELMSIRPDIPIIICTGFSERINKEQAEANKVKGFLMKPIVKSELAQMVRKVLDEAKIS